mmetsp:Transcript_41583/g.104870  ORF Transcript_41583/g.104870 Transcript_41583/m.104870 type:complete len:204 (+) Transcript_41583:1629-2240(+)
MHLLRSRTSLGRSSPSGSRNASLPRWASISSMSCSLAMLIFCCCSELSLNTEKPSNPSAPRIFPPPPLRSLFSAGGAEEDDDSPSFECLALPTTDPTAVPTPCTAVFAFLPRLGRRFMLRSRSPSPSSSLVPGVNLPNSFLMVDPSLISRWASGFFLAAASLSFTPASPLLPPPPPPLPPPARRSPMTPPAAAAADSTAMACW